MSKKPKVRKKRKKSISDKSVQFYGENTPSNTACLRLFEYTITDEPLKLIKIPPAIKEELHEIYYKVYEKPEEVIDRLEFLKIKYPAVPLIYNYLSVGYSLIGDNKKVEEITEDSYRKNPDYLFAKINYAQVSIQRGELEKIPEIFDNKFDLKLLYPKRNTFHISEVVGFWGVMGMYSASLGNTEQARLYYNNLKELAPEEPITKQLKKRLSFLSIKNRLAKLLGKPVKK